MRVLAVGWCLSLPFFAWWSIPRRAWLIILCELSIIIFLSSWLVSEYLDNVYFQTYVNTLMPVLVPVLSVGFGVAAATLATVLYFGTKRIRRTENSDGEDDVRRRGVQKRVGRRTSMVDMKPGRPRTGATQQQSGLKPIVDEKAASASPLDPSSPSEKKDSA